MRPCCPWGLFPAAGKGALGGDSGAWLWARGRCGGENEGRLGREEPAAESRAEGGGRRQGEGARGAGDRAGQEAPA